MLDWTKVADPVCHQFAWTVAIIKMKTRKHKNEGWSPFFHRQNTWGWCYQQEWRALSTTLPSWISLHTEIIMIMNHAKGTNFSTQKFNSNYTIIITYPIWFRIWCIVKFTAFNPTDEANRHHIILSIELMTKEELRTMLILIVGSNQWIFISTFSSLNSEKAFTIMPKTMLSAIVVTMMKKDTSKSNLTLALSKLFGFNWIA